MPTIQYVIVGGGMSADAAVQGIREVDSSGPIAVIGSEPHAPYNRPPLSKALWKGEPESSVWRTTERKNVELVASRRVVSVNRAARRVTDDRGSTWTYGKLLLATGGTPRRLPFGGDAVLYYRTLDDYRRLRSAIGPGKRFAVIGGGFIGAEVAAALAMNDQRVTMFFPEAGIGARVFPADMAEALVGFYREKGVDVRAGAAVEGIDQGGGGARVRLKGGATVDVEGVVAGIGIAPNVELATAAGLKVSDGIEVDEHLRTNDPDIYAAGDVARFPAASLGRAIRVEHEDAALSEGRHAGRAMAGDTAPYQHLPFFYSDLFDLGYEAVGEVDARLATFADWKTRFKEGVVYYLRDGKVAGALMVNTWGQVDAARALIARRETVDPKRLKGRLPA